MVLLHETGQLDDVALEPTSGTPLAPAEGFAVRNPLTKVPALERPDGCTLYDSRVICAYLDDRAGAGLYPQGTSRWDTLTLEATADGMLDAALAIHVPVRGKPLGKANIVSGSKDIGGKHRRDKPAIHVHQLLHFIIHLPAFFLVELGPRRDQQLVKPRIRPARPVPRHAALVSG